MIDVGSVWHDDRNVYYIQHGPRGRTIESTPAVWSVFLDCEDLSSDVILSIARDRNVSLTRTGRYARIDAVRTRDDNWKVRNRDIRTRIIEGLRRQFDAARIREGDVDPATRWIADNPVRLATSLKILYLDIEAQSPGMSIDDAREGRSRILSYAVKGDDEYTHSEILFQDDPRTGDQISEREIDRAEKQLIINLLTIIKRYDAVAAWYGGDVREGRGFDYDCIRNRASHFGIKLRDVYPSGQSPRRDVCWATIIWLDQMEVCKKYGGQKSSFKLDAYAKSVGVDDGKVDFDAARVYEVWSSGPDGRKQILDYNIQDTALLPQIEEKTGFLELHFSVCRLCNQTPHTRALRATRQADGFLLRFSGPRDFHWPTNWWEEEPPDDETEGAFVFDTIPGLWDHVSIADFSALYPSIMLTWNIGPDTVGDNPAHFRGAPYCKAPLIDAYFRMDRESHFKSALKDLIANRARYKERLDDLVPGTVEYAQFSSLSQAAKIVANSFYGVLLCKHYRYFSALAGHAVTSTGQWLIKTVAKHMEELGRGWKIVGGDTDSVFIHTVRDTITAPGSDQMFTSEGVALQAEIQEINSLWPPLVKRMGCTESCIELDWEQSFRRAIFLRKKCYAGTSHYVKGSRPDKPWVHKYRGLALRRGDRIQTAKTMQREVLEAVLGSPSDPVLPQVPTDKEMRRLVRSWKVRITDGELSPNDVIMRQSIRKSLKAYRTEAAFTSPRCMSCRYEFSSKQDWTGPKICPRCKDTRNRRKPPPHILIAEKLAERGESPLPGDKIAYVYEYRPDEDDMGWIPTLASEYDTEHLDRAQYWFATYSPAYTVLSVSHPDGDWERPDRERLEIYRAKKQEHAIVTAGDKGLFAMFTDPGSLFE